jgi:hypothetical protein
MSWILEDILIRASLLELLTKYRSGDQIKNTEFWYEKLREGDHLEDPGVRWDGNIKMDLR